MIIDVHGHWTTAPVALQVFRDAQLAALDRPGSPPPADPMITDDQLRQSVEEHQLTVMRERGVDLVLLSPKASGMEHHVPDQATAEVWARINNDLVGRLAGLFPERIAAVCQLPQTPGGPVAPLVAEVRRCVEQLGFVGCNLNPDPSGGGWTSPPLTDSHWFPLYETVEELDVPVMVHVSTSCNPNSHTLGAHYLNADTNVFMQLLLSDLFERFPGLRIVIPHGGGAVPYHWGRYRGLAMRMERPGPERLWGNLFFDTCVYHQPGMDLLTSVVPVPSLLFASEMLGAVRGVDPETRVAWDDTLSYINRSGLDEGSMRAVLSENALRIFPRLVPGLSDRDPDRARDRDDGGV